jgi:predicted esterase
MTRQDREAAIAGNIGYVDTVCDRLAAEFGAARALVFAGFSQGVGMAYRAGVLGRHACAGIIVAGGDLPPELRTAGTGDWPRVLAVTGAGDAYYTPALLERDMGFLRTHSRDARMLVFEGGHEWGDAVVRAAGEMLAAIEGELPAG